MAMSVGMVISPKDWPKVSHQMETHLTLPTLFSLGRVMRSLCPLKERSMSTGWREVASKTEGTGRALRSKGLAKGLKRFSVLPSLATGVRRSGMLSGHQRAGHFWHQ